MKIRLGPRPARRVFDERPIFAVMFLAMFVMARWFPFQRNPYMCSFKQITGYPCFSCGMTRSWVHAVHGQVIEGLQQSPYGSFLFLLALAFTLWTVLRFAFRLPSLKFALSRWESAAVWAFFVVGLIGNWVYTIITGMA